MINARVFNSLKSFLNSKIFGDIVLWVEGVEVTDVLYLNLPGAIA